MTVKVQLIGAPREVAAMAQLIRRTAEVSGQSPQQPAKEQGRVIVYLKATAPAEGDPA